MKKIMIYCQHLAGMGHLVRCREIIQSMVQDFEVCLVTGGQRVPQFQWPVPVDVIQLPALCQKNGTIAPLSAGYSLAAVKASRTQQLLEIFDQFQPDCLITECFPFSKLAMNYELGPLLKRAKALAKPVPVICSLRDLIMTQPFSEEARERREAKIRRLIDQFYDAVLIHADPSFQDLEEYFPLLNTLECDVVYTGYVVQPMTKAQALVSSLRSSGLRHAPSIVASTGGGRHGYSLLSSVIAASALLAESCPHQIHAFAGPFMPEQDLLQLQQMAVDVPSITLRRYTNQLMDYLSQADLSINLGGYNTTMNLLSTGVRSLLLPSPNPSQTDEQRIRAEKLADLGLVTLLTPADLQPKRLAKAMTTAIAQPPTPHQIDLDGAHNTANYLRTLFAEQPALTNVA